MGWKTEERRLDMEPEKNGLENGLEVNGFETEERRLGTKERGLGSEGIEGKNNPCFHKDKIFTINVTEIATKFK